MRLITRISFLTLLLFPLSCEKDNPVDAPDAAPSMEIVSNKLDGSTLCVGEEVDIDFIFIAEATIKSFSIIKNGTEVLVTRDDVPFNQFTFSATYLVNNQDLDNGTVSLSAELTDLENRTTTEEITYNIVAEFAYANADFSPDPSYDLANNMVVSDSISINADLFLRVDRASCGAFCTSTRYTFVSKNETRFYNIPANAGVNYIQTTFKQADVIAAITGVSPQTSLVVSSNFPEDLTANGFLNAFPVVAEIRGTGEYAILDADLGDPNNATFRYKKRTELAGN